MFNERRISLSNDTNKKNAKNKRRKQPNKKGVFRNSIAINGVVNSCDSMTNYIPHPLFGFELHSPIVAPFDFLEKMKNDSQEDVSSFRCVVLNDEEAYDIITEGSFVNITGEIQSRNYEKFHPIEEPELQNAVDLYHSIFDEFPTKKQPEERSDEIIQWSKLFELDLLNDIPTDSIFDEEQILVESESNIYYYKVDWNGGVKRITPETIYEVLIHNYQVLDEKPEYFKNEVDLLGRISSEVQFDINENGPEARFTLHNYLNYFKGVEKRFSFLPIRVFGDEAMEIFDKYKRGDFIELEGNLFSFNKDKVLRNKKITPSGKVKRKRAEFKEREHFVLLNNIKKQ